MPRYFFDIFDSNGLARDEEGMDFGTMDEAVAEARRTLGGLVKDALLEGDESQIEIRIRDGAEGPVILSVTMRSVRPDEHAEMDG
ncbi:MAG TPA: hypothetical protein VIN06_18655 [Devosia sp.]